MGLECGWCHAWKRWSWEFEDFEKEAVEIERVEFLPLRHRVEFSTVAVTDKFFGTRPAKMNWDLIHYKMHVFFWGGGQQSKNCVSLLVLKNRNQKLINHLYLKQQSLPVFVNVFVSQLWLRSLWLWLYSHLPPITKTIKIRWRSRDKLISDVLLWIPSHGQAKAGWPARTYIQQLCANMECSPEDLLEAIDDRKGWWERVRDADSMTWWWW